jgi:hypothetical protein
MYKNIAWCTGLGITEEGDWNGGNLGNDHAARRCFNLSLVDIELGTFGFLIYERHQPNRRFEPV